MIQQLTLWFLGHLTYWTVLLLMIVESSFIPFPSEVVVPPAAFLAVSEGEMNIYLVVLFATIGAVIGALVNYYLALWLGRPLVYRFADSRLGRMLLLSSEKLDRANEYFNRNGGVSTFVGRLMPGIRQLISIPAGLARMPLFPFIGYTALGALVWNSILALIGAMLTHIPGIETKEQVIELANQYSHVIGYTILLVVVLIMGYYLWRRRSLSRK